MGKGLWKRMRVVATNVMVEVGTQPFWRKLKGKWRPASKLARTRNKRKWQQQMKDE